MVLSMLSDVRDDRLLDLFECICSLITSLQVHCDRRQTEQGAKTQHNQHRTEDNLNNH